jgi:hypothetical protein
MPVEPLPVEANSCHDDVRRIDRFMRDLAERTRL